MAVDNIKCANHWRQPVESEFQADFQSDWQAQLGGNGDTSGVSRMVLHFKEGMKIAQEFDVSTEPNCAVVYSISFLATTQNRDMAYAYVKTHKGYKTLDDTPCGKTLCEKGYQGTNDVATNEIKEIWKVASERFIGSASGNITAFVENADERSTFRRIELPNIIANKKIKTINGVDKFQFFQKFKK